MDCSPPGSSVHGTLQARTLEWVAMPSSRESSRSRGRNHNSYISSIDRWVLLPPAPPGKPHLCVHVCLNNSRCICSGRNLKRENFLTVGEITVGIMLWVGKSKWALGQSKRIEFRREHRKFICIKMWLQICHQWVDVVKGGWRLLVWLPLFLMPSLSVYCMSGPWLSIRSFCQVPHIFDMPSPLWNNSGMFQGLIRFQETAIVVPKGAWRDEHLSKCLPEYLGSSWGQEFEAVTLSPITKGW